MAVSGVVVSPNRPNLIPVQSSNTSNTGSRPLGRPLTILARPSRTVSLSSLDMNLSQETVDMTTVSSIQASQVPRMTELQPIHIPGSHSLPATPPPDPDFAAGSQLIDGVGGHFPPSLPSRASSLTMESESGATPRGTDIHAASDASGLDDERLETPRAETYTFETPAWTAPPRGRMLALLDPLTPSPTPKRTRGSSPPSAPRPSKRPRIDVRAGYDDSGNEGDSEEEVIERAGNQVFRNVRRLTIDLAGSTGNAVDTSAALGLGTIELNNMLSHSAPCTPHKARAHEPSEPSKPSYRSRQESELTNAGRNFLDSTPCNPREENSTKGDFTMAIECFTEEEVEEDLAELLGAYRSFYLDPDEAEPPRPRDPAAGRRSRQIFKAIFGDQLNSAEDEAFLLQEEEEDILDAFVAWLREKGVLSEVQSETSSDTFEGLLEGLGGVGDMAVAPFIKKIV